MGLKDQTKGFLNMQQTIEPQPQASTSNVSDLRRYLLDLFKDRDTTLIAREHSALLDRVNKFSRQYGESLDFDKCIDQQTIVPADKVQEIHQEAERLLAHISQLANEIGYSMEDGEDYLKVEG